MGSTKSNFRGFKAMIDVDEIYKIPKSRLKETVDVKPLKDDKPELNHLFSQLNLFKSGRFNMFERHVNQLLIRGDNVVTIAFADN